jgi:hypothetical protein
LSLSWRWAGGDGFLPGAEQSHEEWVMGGGRGGGGCELVRQSPVLERLMGGRGACTSEAGGVKKGSERGQRWGEE